MDSDINAVRILGWNGTFGSATVAFNGFDDGTAAAFSLVGNASSSLWLVPVEGGSGAAWFKVPQSVYGGFDTTFSFLSYPWNGGGGTFSIQNSPDGLFASPTTAGDPGGVANSVAITFTHSSDVVTITTRGSDANAPLVLAQAELDWHPDGTQLRVAYVPGTLNVYINAATTPAMSVALDIGEIGVQPNACLHTQGNAGTVCRASAGSCDAQEVCHGSVPSCPSDAKLTSVCRGSAGDCDIEESCDAINDDCPPDVVRGLDEICRGAVDECDAAETCSGSDVSCPTDARLMAGVSCTDDGYPCTVDRCDGSNVACQHDAAAAAGQLCRDLAGLCDQVELCTGSDPECPADGYDTGTLCRVGSGECDVAEYCSGASAFCPANGFVGAGVSCGSSTETECSAADSCDGAGSCNPRDVAAGQACGSADVSECDLADNCDGYGACSVNYVASGTTCGDSDDCSTHHCDSGGSCSYSPGAECADRAPFGIAAVPGYAAPAFADFDGDGDLDLMAGSDASSGPLRGLYYFENTGSASSASFASAVQGAFGLTTNARRTAPAIADVDGNSTLDVVVGDLTGATTLYSGSGESAANVLPKGFVITIDDTTLSGDADDPENFLAGKASALLLAAGIDDESGPANSTQHFVRYALKRGKESVASPLYTTAYAKPVKHAKRAWQLSNRLGSISVESKKESSLLVASSLSLSAALSGGPGQTHFICYGVKLSAATTAQQSAGVLRTDLQVFTADAFADCANSAAFAGSVVQGKCLVSLLMPVELCNPADLSNVEPPRLSSASITPSTASVSQSLLCYAGTLAGTVTSSSAALLGGVEVGAVLTQARHRPHLSRTGSPVYTYPGGNFATPTQVDTKKRKLVCLPTDVLSVAPIE